MKRLFKIIMICSLAISIYSFADNTYNLQQFNKLIRHPAMQCGAHECDSVECCTDFNACTDNIYCCQCYVAHGQNGGACSICWTGKVINKSNRD